MKITKVADALRKKLYYLSRQTNDPNNKPRLAVYMDRDFYMQCITEIQSEESSYAFDFIDNQALMGFPVWQVTPGHSRNVETKHQDFIIVDLDECTTS